MIANVLTLPKADLSPTRAKRDVGTVLWPEFLERDAGSHWRGASLFLVERLFQCRSPMGIRVRIAECGGREQEAERDASVRRRGARA